MTIDTQLVPITLVKGLDTKADSKSAPTGDLHALVNATFTNPGKIRKRFGRDALSVTVPDAADISTAAGLALRGDELLLADGTNVYSRSTPDAEWIDKGPLPSPTVSVGPGINAGSASVVGYDCAQHEDGLRCMVAELWSPLFGAVGATCSGVVYSIVDTLTGNTIVSQTLLSASYRNPSVIVVGGSFYIFATTSTTLSWAPISVTAPTTAAVLNGIGSVNSNTPNHAEVYDPRTGYIYVVSGNNTANPANGMVVQSFTPGNTTPVGTVTKASIYARTFSIVIDEYSHVPIVAWVNSNTATVGFSVYSGPDLVESTTGLIGANATNPTAISLVSIPATAASPLGVEGVVACYMTVPDAQFVPYPGGGVGAVGTTNGNGRDSIVVGFIRSNGGWSGDSTTYTLVKGARLAGRCATNGSDVVAFALANAPTTPVPYVPAIFAAGTSSTVADPVSTLFLLHGFTGQAVIRLWQGTSAAMWFNSTCSVNTVPGMLPGMTDLGGGSFVFAAGVVTQFSNPTITSAAPVFYSLTSAQAVTFDFSDPVYGFEGAEIAQATLFSGGCPTLYDGGGATTEHGFNYSPHRVQVVASTTGGILAAGTYGCAAIYEWIDANGLIHWSGAATVVSVTTTGSTSKMTWTVPTLRMTSKTGVRVVLFRTLVNGSVYYRLTNTGGASASDVLLNSTSLDYVTFTDSSTSDTVLASRAQLYTTGGVLENDAPPPLLCPIVHRRRVIGIDASDRLSLPYSKQVGSGDPVEFSLAFVLSASPAGGDCTALASLDDKLIAFKSDRIFMWTGQGPDSTGGANDWSECMLVSSDVGCTAPKSLVLTPGGLLFQSEKGIYRLGRDLSVSYIGAPVEAYNAQPVLGACLMADVQQVRFTQAAQTLVYDYGVGQWSVFAFGGTAVDSLVWRGVHTHALSTGVVTTEATHYHDPGSTFVPVSFTTSWISLAGLQGYKRVRRMLLDGMMSTPNTVNVEIATDLDAEDQFVPYGGMVMTLSSAQTMTFDPARTAAGNWQERIHVRWQKCEALQIAVTETQNGANFDAYFDLSAITLEVGIKRGAKKMPAALSVGS